ncbi:MAG TPA: (2Fe-2S)-binding protein [Rhodocyclaceae bacterium]|nr:(2Fe-2S)-binding protein [Rhodocyclaceae bacterium]
MYVCICNAVTDSQILAAVDAGHGSLKALRQHLGVAAECGRCARCAADLVKSCQDCGQCSKHGEHDHAASHQPVRRAASGQIAHA